MSEKDIANPSYYKACSKLGREVLEKAQFPQEYSAYLDKECKHFISEVLQDNFYLGNAFKYIWRLGEKDNYPWLRTLKISQDLQKANWYLTEWIQNNVIGESIEVWEASNWLVLIRLQINLEIDNRYGNSILDIFR